MKVALVYDWLNIKVGGGETTFIEITKLYPKADIYCLVYNQSKFEKYFENRNIRTSRLQKFPNFIKKRPQLMLPFIKKAVNQLEFDGYDMVISVSSAWVKNIHVSSKTIHICYCYSPARMIWDSWPKYLDTQKIGPFRLGSISRFIITKLVSKIRLWDYYSSNHVDSFIAISKFIQGRIAKFYRRNSDLVYPPVIIGDGHLVPSKKREYFLILSSLSRYKNVDIAIRACVECNKKLVIVGDGPDKKRLMDIANNNQNIVFAGRADENKKWEYYRNAKALIFPSIEDFGIAPVEAMSVGTPIIALEGGGLTETVKKDIGGIFYKDYKGLIDTINDFEAHEFSPVKIRSSVMKFDIDKFKSNFTHTVDRLYKIGKYEKQS
ncbi:MAG TPA: glycosyltransferase [Candidatus Saccharibacteria bacterium]|nr:glycosyltransferase [Candidatus Saccharibacteria bacterium]HMT39313.1 glycosyltransferase [Candidatus Saccharibacteria bacterium]